MGEYVDIHGHPTWVHRCASGGPGRDTILLLHGGLSCSEDLLPSLAPHLGVGHDLVAFDRRGHGHTRDSPEPFHYAAMAREVVGVIDHLGGPVHLVGWSDGGIAALLASLERPDLVHRQVVIGANFHHDGVVADVPDGQSPLGAAMQRAYAERSPDGADHFAVVEAKFEQMAASEPTLTVADLSRVTTPTLVLAGDDDMIRLDHTVALYEALPESQLGIVPGTSHALPVEKPALVATLIRDFLAGPVPPLTALPVRRGGSSTRKRDA